MADITWAAYVDWNNDGDFLDANEDISADLVSVAVKGGRSGATDDFAAGEARIVVENPSGKYSRYNASSPIYGQMINGRGFKLEATHNAITYPRFRGELIDTQETVTLEGIPAVELTFLDAFETLRRGSIRTALLESQRVDQVIGTILDAAGWPAGRRSLDVADATLPLFWQYRASPLDALKLAAKQELGGALYVNAAGDVRFENRSARLASSLYATITDPLSLSLGFRQSDLIDRVKFTYAALTLATTTTVVYNLDPGGWPIDPGSTATLNTISGEYSVGAKNAIEPVPGVDIFANSQSNGLGVDKTSQLSVASFTSYGGGFSCTLNNADAARVYLLGTPAFQVRAQAVQRSNAERAIEVLASSPIVSQQELSDAFEWNDNADGIRAFALWRAATLSIDQPRPTLELQCRLDADIAIALGLDVSKLIQITNTTGLYPSQVDGRFFVEGFALSQAIGEDLRASISVFSGDQGLGSVFVISGAAGGGQDYSLIVAAGATSGDRFGW